MPRYKTKVKLLSGSELKNGDGGGGTDEALNGVVTEKKGKGTARGTAVTASIEQRKGRSKKTAEEADVKVNGTPVDDPEPVKKAASGRSKAKKGLDVQNVQIEEEVEKKAVSKGRGKKAATEPEIAEETAKPKGRAKNVKAQTKPEAAEKDPVPAESPKVHIHREKTPEIEEPMVEPVQKTNKRGTKKKPEIIKGTVAPKRGSKKLTPAVLKEPEPPTIEQTDAAAGSALTAPKRGAKTKKILQVSVEEKVPKKKAKLTEPKKKRGGAKTTAQPVSVDEPAEPVIKAVETKVRGRKRPATEVDVEEATTKKAADGVKSAKSNSKTLLNSTESKYDKVDFLLNPSAGDGGDDAERFNLKISSWNVAGLRSWVKKDGLKFLEYEEPDIFCMQETKCHNEQLPEEVTRLPGYHPYWLCMPGGYAGVAVYSKIMPINVEYGIGDEEFDKVGRMITAEYEKFYLINVYVPNSGRKLVNLEARMRWEKLFQEFVKKLDEIKPVLICGDMNVSHSEIDLANPKANTRSAGFTKEEREKMSELLDMNLVDTFRHLYPKRIGAYTYWTYMSNARSRNVGWRLDYFIISQRMVSRVVDNCIRSQVMGSDHCPITLFMKI